MARLLYDVIGVRFLYQKLGENPLTHRQADRRTRWIALLEKSDNISRAGTT